VRNDEDGTDWLDGIDRSKEMRKRKLDCLWEWTRGVDVGGGEVLW
jgi:hypothetical protein